MSGTWSLDMSGLSSLLGQVQEDVSEIDTGVRQAEKGFDGCAAALDGPVASAFASFVEPRRNSPQEVRLMVDAAVRGASASAAALTIGDQEMAERIRHSRMVSEGFIDATHGREAVPA